MKNLGLLVISVLLLIGCKNQPKGNFTVQGKIRGFKKGTIYLEKIEKNKRVIVDSLYLKGDENYSFTTDIETPEVFYLSLKELPKQPILFFGEKGTVIINTDIKNFFLKAKISGSKSQDILAKHDAYTDKTLFRNVDIYKEKFDALKAGDTLLVQKLENEFQQNLKRQYLFSTNYAIQHKDSEVAAFIALTKISKATPKLKMQIYDSLAPNIKTGKYGKLLKAHIKDMISALTSQSTQK